VLTGGPSASLASAYVTISEVGVADRGGRQTLRREPFTVDLVGLSSGVRVLVRDAWVPDRLGESLHLYLSGAMIEVGESRTLYATPDYPPASGLTVERALQMPDAMAGALDVDAGDLPRTERADLLVRFDTDESFAAERGAWGSWVLRPVLHVLPLRESASMMVAVALAPGMELPAGVDLGRFQASLVDAEGNLEAVVPLVDGEDGAALATFELIDAREGPFSVELDAPGVRFAVAEPERTASWIAAPGDAAVVDVTLTELEAL
jgi:hypothetical protein